MKKFPFFYSSNGGPKLTFQSPFFGSAGWWNNITVIFRRGECVLEATAGVAVLYWTQNYRLLSSDSVIPSRRDDVLASCLG